MDGDSLFWRVRPTHGATPQWPELIVAGADRIAIAAAYRSGLGIPDETGISTFPADPVPMPAQPQTTEGIDHGNPA